MKDQRLEQAEKDGEFKRQKAQFRNTISDEDGSKFKPEKNRYVLYYSPTCPWAGRTLIFLKLKHLEEIISAVKVSSILGPNGWYFTDEDGGLKEDPYYGFKFVHELYHKADPSYNLRFTVPILWDLKNETIVNNESSEIIRILNSSFNKFIPKDLQIDYYPKAFQKDIDDINEWIYDTVNNGVYKTGFATTQEAYNAHVYPLFESLDKIEKILSKKQYLVGPESGVLTEADIRLFVTIARFDVAYVTLFRTNIRTIRYGYPNIDKWYRRLYYSNDAFSSTIDFDLVKKGYASVVQKPIPAGPIPAILPADY